MQLKNLKKGEYFRIIRAGKASAKTYIKGEQEITTEFIY